MSSPGSKHEKMIQLEFAINSGEQACRKIVLISSSVCKIVHCMSGGTSSACKIVHCVSGGTLCYFVLYTSQSSRSIEALQYIDFWH